MSENSENQSDQIKNTISFLDELEAYNWDMEPIDRSIDPIKYQKYISQKSMSKNKGELVEIIVKYTRYIPFQEFKGKLIETIMKINTDFVLLAFNFFPGVKIGSEHWITILAWPYIKHKCMGMIYNLSDIKNLNPNTAILLLDDCIYSGSRIESIIDSIRSDYKEKYTKRVLNTFLVVAPYANKHTINRLKLGKPISFIVGKSFKPFLFNQEFESAVDRQFDSQEERFEDFLYNILEMECPGTPLALYFDHKIANGFGSFPGIYNEIVRNPISREKIVQLNRAIIF